MKILFIANYQIGPGGEAADEIHISRELKSQGDTVYEVPRDEWREYVIENSPQNKYKVPEDIKPDIAIIGKWHHFYDGSFIKAIKEKYHCPVLYWVWDFMEGEDTENCHIKMAKEADLYLSGELGKATFYHNTGINFYYFQFDSVDRNFPVVETPKKEYDVIYTGSWNNQGGRGDMLKEINKLFPIHVFGYDYKEWIKQGFNARSAVYGYEFNKVIAQSKIVLGTSAGPHCAGYWSNRVGKVLYAEGFLLQQYTPMMEQFLGNSCAYYSDVLEAVEKIHYYLDNPEEIVKIKRNNFYANPSRWTSSYKVTQLLILMERYLKEGKKWMLP